MTETRTEIEDAVYDHPGIHFSELVRQLDLAPGQVQYHLKRLRAEDSVVDERLYDRTHYYPPDATLGSGGRSRCCAERPQATSLPSS